MSDVTALERDPSARELLAGIKIIDVDTHISEWEDLWTSRAPAKFKDLVPRIVDADTPERRWVIGEDILIRDRGAASALLPDGSKPRDMGFWNRTNAEVHPSSYDVRARLRMMDEQGIHAQIAYPNILGFSGQKAQKADAALRLLSMQIFNDAMAQVQRDSGERIFPMIMLPWWDLDESLAEAERCVEMGMRGINWNPDTHTAGLPSMANPYWDPLWDMCVANGLPVNFHIGASDGPMQWFGEMRLPELGPNHSLASGSVLTFIGNLRVMTNILASRMLEKHPELKIVSVESGSGWVPYLLEALEYMASEVGADFATPPSEVFRRQIYTCSFFERKNFVDTVRQVGADNIMFETDFPHPACLYPDALDYLSDAIAELTEEERFKIFSGNAAKLYNIDIS